MQNYALVVFQKRKVAVYKNFEGSVTFNYSNIDVYNIHTKFLPAFWMKAHKWSLLEQWRRFEFEFTCKSWPWEKINYCIYQRVKEFSCRLNLVSTTDCTHSWEIMQFLWSLKNFYAYSVQIAWKIICWYILIWGWWMLLWK